VCACVSATLFISRSLVSLVALASTSVGANDIVSTIISTTLTHTRTHSLQPWHHRRHLLQLHLMRQLLRREPWRPKASIILQRFARTLEVTEPTIRVKDCPLHLLHAAEQRLDDLRMRRADVMVLCYVVENKGMKEQNKTKPGTPFSQPLFQMNVSDPSLSWQTMLVFHQEKAAPKTTIFCCLSLVSLLSHRSHHR
jgi:hypothetical protein